VLSKDEESMKFWRDDLGEETRVVIVLCDRGFIPSIEEDRAWTSSWVGSVPVLFSDEVALLIGLWLTVEVEVIEILSKE